MPQTLARMKLNINEETKRKAVWECAVSWSWLLQFAREHHNQLQSLTTSQVVTQIVIPATKEKAVRYVDFIPSDCVSTPTYFISHTWGSPFLDLIRSLKAFIPYSETDPISKTTFVWLDIFAVNQITTSTEQSTDLKSLHRAIQEATKGTLVCLDLNCKLLTRFFSSILTKSNMFRIWCLFEIWHTFLMSADRLVVATDIVDFEKWQKVFVDCNVGDADATVKADRDRILNEIKQKIPLDTMNKNIKHALVESARLELERAETSFSDSITISFLCHKYARVLNFLGKYDESLPILQRAYDLIHMQPGREGEVAEILNNMGIKRGVFL